MFIPGYKSSKYLGKRHILESLPHTLGHNLKLVFDKGYLHEALKTELQRCFGTLEARTAK